MLKLAILATCIIRVAKVFGKTDPREDPRSDPRFFDIFG